MNIPINQIGFDFDGVIADTATAFLEIACQRYGHCGYTINDICNFEVEDCIDIPKEIVTSIFEDILNDSLSTKVAPIEGAIETLSHFSSHSPITIITARNKSEPVEDWLKFFFDERVKNNFLVIATGSPEEKLQYMQSREIKYFVDDRAATCTELARKNIIPIVFTQPWNRDRHSLQSVSNWKEIEALVEAPVQL